MSTRYEWALFLHLVGVVLFFSGGAVAAVALESARRRERAAEIASILGLARIGALLTGVGTLVILVFGIWLVHLGKWPWGSAWIDASLGLLVAAAVVGGLGGRWPKEARLLATRLAAEGREDRPALRRLLDHPLSLALNYGAGLLGLAILGLMVFKPGS
jgi:uncharacterized membrane protein